MTIFGRLTQIEYINMSRENTPTPHNAAKYGDIAKTVIMAGDPIRVKYIAESLYLRQYHSSLGS